MTIWHRSALIVGLMMGSLAIGSGCTYRLGRATHSVEAVSYGFLTTSLLSPEVESIIRQSAWREVSRRVQTGAGCTLQLSVIEAEYSPSLGGLSRVQLVIEGKYGDGLEITRSGLRSFVANSPEEADELRLRSYDTLTTSLVSGLVLELLTNGDSQCR